MKVILSLLLLCAAAQAENLTAIVDGPLIEPTTGKIRIYGQFKNKDLGGAQDGTWQAKVCWDDSTCSIPANDDIAPINYATSGPYCGISGGAYTICPQTPTCTTGCAGIDYTITTRGAGPNPLDGAQHTVYVKFLSKLNPGVMRTVASGLVYGTVGCATTSCSGDIWADGGPVPFKYTNGTFDRYAVATNRSRLLPKQATIVVNTSDTYSTGSASPVTVAGVSYPSSSSCVVGGNTIYDNGAAWYYALATQTRYPSNGITCDATHFKFVAFTPATSPFPATTTTSITMTEATFISTILPVMQGLDPSIQVVLFAFNGPSMVTPTVGTGHGYQSFLYTASVAALNYTASSNVSVMSTGSKCIDLNANLMGQAVNPVSGGGTNPFNPYFNSTSSAPYTDYGWRLSWFLSGESAASCTNTAACNVMAWIPNFGSFKTMTDNVTAAMSTNPSTGVAYWAYTSDYQRSTSPLYVSGNSLGTVGVPNTVLSSAPGRLANSLLVGTPTVTVPTAPTSQNILFMADAGPSWFWSGNPTFISGAAFAYALTSTAGALPNDNSQGPDVSWVNPSVAGSTANFAAGTYGSAFEPCQSVPRKFPVGEVFLPNYTAGRTLGESAWASVQIVHTATFMGDFFAAPFTLLSSTAGSVWSGVTFGGVLR